MKMKYEIERIERANYNGRNVKIAKIYEVREHDNLFHGSFAVPVKIANKNIISYLTSNGEL